MQKPIYLCSEEQLLLIQQITHASRQDILFTIRHSRISVESIIQCLQKLPGTLLHNNRNKI